MRKKILSLLTAGCILLQGICPVVSAQEPKADKNYVIQIVTDGLSDKLFDQLKAKGAKTPNLDSIILGGSRFRNVQTTVPSYAASSAAGMTGASAEKNDCLIEYCEGGKSIGSVFNMKAENIFNKLNADKSVNGVMASGWRVGSTSISTLIGFPTGDPNFVFNGHNSKDNFCSITTVADDIIASINAENTPQFMSAYSNDIMMKGWIAAPTDEGLISTLELIDAKVGEVKSAVTSAGIADKTTFIIGSLANATLVSGKVGPAAMAAEIKAATGVDVQDEKFKGKASIQNQYYLSYAQLYFMPSATDQDKQAVLNYLNTDGTPVGNAVEKVVTPAEVGAPEKFADYIICPVEGKSFCLAGPNIFRADDMHNSNVFMVVSGAQAPKHSSIADVNPTILDIVPTICSILGVNEPKDNEGKVWTYEKIQEKPVLSVATPQNNQKIYKPEVNVVGLVDCLCDVKVNNKPATINGANFLATVPLTEGENIINVTAENSYGISTEHITVNYVKPVVAPEGNRTVYINWDGCARYYIDEALKQGKNIPTIKNIIEHDGVFFNNANTRVPSITNPLQQAIVSGTTPLFTDNHYRYFSKEQGSLIQEDPPRKDEAETIAESCVRQGLDVISINQFALEDKGTTSNDQRALYVDAGDTNGAITRFDAAIKMVKELKAGSITLDQVPRFIALYMDDLDGIGHNDKSVYGYPLAKTENERMKNNLGRLEEMDKKLGEFIQACKDVGIYDTMSFVLTADHGMANFGQQEAGGETYNSSLDDMMRVIESLGDGYKCESLIVDANEKPSADTDIAIISVGLQAQLSYVKEFDSAVIAQKNAKIIEALKNEVYVDVILTPDQIKAEGIREAFADLIVSPKPPYSFKTGDYETVRAARGQHDTYNDKAKKITALMWGKNIKKGVTISEKIYNTDFMATLSALMGVNAPLDSTGKVIYSALDGIKAPNEIKTVKSYTKGNSVTATQETNRLEIEYSSLNNGKLQLNVNGKKVRDVFFPETNSIDKKLTKVINISLKKGDVVEFTSIDNQNSNDISFNQISFVGINNNINSNTSGGAYISQTLNEDSVNLLKLTQTAKTVKITAQKPKVEVISTAQIPKTGDTTNALPVIIIGIMAIVCFAFSKKKLIVK